VLSISLALTGVQSSSGALMPPWLSENDVQLWDGWGKNENMKPSQESCTFWKKASLWQNSKTRAGSILLQEVFSEKLV